MTEETAKVEDGAWTPVETTGFKPQKAMYAAAATQSRRPRGLLEPALRATITTAVAPALDAASDAAAVVAARPRAMIVAPP